MESADTAPAGLSVSAQVAIACNAFVGLLLLLLFLVLYQACKVPSNPERLPVLALPSLDREAQPGHEHKYLLTS